MPKPLTGGRRGAAGIGTGKGATGIVSGSATDAYEGPPDKSAAALELGRRAGRRRADSMSAERRAEIARSAARRR